MTTTKKQKLMEQPKTKQTQRAYILKDSSYIDSTFMRLDIVLPGSESDYNYKYYDISDTDNNNIARNALFVHITNGSDVGIADTSSYISHQLDFSEISRDHPNRGASFDIDRGNGDTLIIVFHDTASDESTIFGFMDYYTNNKGIGNRFNNVANNSYRAYRDDIPEKGKDIFNPKKAGISIVRRP